MKYVNKYVVTFRSYGICQDPTVYGVFTEKVAKEVKEYIESKWTKKDLMDEPQCEVVELSPHYYYFDGEVTK